MTTPLRKAVDEYVNKGLSRFHMPGHKGAECFPDYYKYDITEVEGADSLFEASGAIREAEERFAEIYGAGASLLSAGCAYRECWRPFSVTAIRCLCAATVTLPR